MKASHNRVWPLIVAIRVVAIRKDLCGNSAHLDVLYPGCMKANYVRIVKVAIPD